MQMKPVESSLLPDKHSQMKDPRLFLQAPLTQGLLSHSFISIIQKETCQTHCMFLENIIMYESCHEQHYARMSGKFTVLRKELNVYNAENVWQADNSACIIL